MKFSETVKSTDPALVVSRKHDQWMVDNPNPVYSTEALALAAAELSKTQRVRTGTISASSLGECPRRQQFAFLGMPQIPADAQGAMRMQNGNFMHLRWQMSGLTAGWLKQAEVSVVSEQYRLQGTMDGVLYDDSILELKSTNMNGFSRVQAFGPLIPHLFQMATYMLCSGRTSGVFIYECKDNQEYKEIVLTNEQVPLLGVKNKAEGLWRMLEKKELYEPLEKCIDHTGFDYTSCPFKDRCLKIHDWAEVADGRHLEGVEDERPV